MSNQYYLRLWYGGDIKKRVPEAKQRVFSFTNTDGQVVTHKFRSVRLLKICPTRVKNKPVGGCICIVVVAMEYLFNLRLRLSAVRGCLHRVSTPHFCWGFCRFNYSGLSGNELNLIFIWAVD